MINANQPVRQMTPVLLTSAKPNQPIEKLGLLKADGTPFDPSVAPTAGQILLTGYTAHAVGALSATDTSNVAFAKLEARIAALEAA